MRIRLIVLLAVALALAACGGGGGGGVGAGTDASTAFFSTVAAIAATPVDTAEADPALIDGATAASSDTAEPVPI